MTNPSTADLAIALARLDAAWSSTGAFIGQIAANGRPEHEVRSALAAIGIAPPSEVVTWFGWHDGVRDPIGRPRAHAFSGIGNLQLLSLDEAIEQTLVERGVATDVAGDEGEPPSRYWRDDWLPLLTYPLLVVRCNAEVIGPVRLVGRDELVEPDRVDAPSLALLVLRWVELIERGDWIYDPAAMSWDAAPGASVPRI